MEVAAVIQQAVDGELGVRAIGLKDRARAEAIEQIRPGVIRGGAGALLDRYDIAANTWENALAYAPATETFGAGTKLAYNGDYLYLQKDSSSRWFRYDFAQSAMDGWTTMLYPQGAAVVGDTAFDVTYRDGNTEIVYIHMLLNSSAVNLRQLVI